MNSRKILFVFGLLTSSVLFSQSIELPMDYIRNKNHGQDTNTEVIQGSKYLNEKFQNGKIILNDNEINTLLRYNGLIDEFELKNNTNKEVASIVRSREIKFVVGSENFALFNYTNENGSIAQGYFQILNNGPFKLLKKNKVILNAAEPAANSYSQAKPAKYVNTVNYYLVQEDKPVQQIQSLRKKNILDLLSTDKAEFYVKENKLKLKTEEEIIQLLNYLNNSI